MCGLYGYLGRQPADPTMLQQLALAAGVRGPHAHGWSTWPAAADSPRLHRRLGRLTPQTAHLPADATNLIGHARLATVSAASRTSINDIQPLLVDRQGNRLTVAHNGNIYTVARSRQLSPPATGNDSELIGLLLAEALDSFLDDSPAGSLQRVLDAIGERGHRNRYAVLIQLDDDTLLYARRGLPLYQARDQQGGLWLCSRDPATVAPGLTASRMLPEGSWWSYQEEEVTVHG